MDWNPTIIRLDEKIAELETAKAIIQKLAAEDNVKVFSAVIDRPNTKTNVPLAKKTKLALRISPAAVADDKDGQRICKKCGIKKPLEDYPKNPRGKAGREGSCKQCKNASKHKKPAENKPEDKLLRIEDGKYICNLCNSVCSTKEKFNEHLYKVHDMEA